MTTSQYDWLCAALCLGLLALIAFSLVFPECFDAGIFGVIALGTAFALKDNDSSLKKSWALSNGAGSTNSAGIDLGTSSDGDFVAGCEVLISAPALTTTQLPNGDTMTYDIEMDSDENFGSPTTIISGALVQTGAGGAGAAAANEQVRLPADVEQHIRCKATKTGTGDASTVSATVQLVF